MKFEEIYKTMFDKNTNPNIPLFYTDLWTAIHAIELAVSDTDPVKIAEAARSGEFKCLAGHCHVTSDEEPVLPWGAGINLRNQNHPGINT